MLKVWLGNIPAGRMFHGFQNQMIQKLKIARGILKPQLFAIFEEY